MLKLKRLFTLILSGAMCVTCALGFAACGGSGSGDNTEAEVTSVSISGDGKAYIGYTSEVTLSVVMSDGSEYDGEITWASSVESIATVADGTITGVAEGTADITATAGGVTSEAYTVTVGERPSDVVDAAGWVAAMTSTNIYNSMATVYTGSDTIILCLELTSTDDGIVGDASYITYYDDGSTTEYYYIQESTFRRCYSGDDNSCWISESDYTKLLYNFSMWYFQLVFSDESYFGGDYFNYDEETGTYVWEESYSSSTGHYEVKIIDGNVVYARGYEYRISGDDITYSDAFEVYYTYGISVTIPDDIRSQLEALTLE